MKLFPVFAACVLLLLGGCQGKGMDIPAFVRNQEEAQEQAPPPPTYTIHVDAVQNRTMVMMYHDMVPDRRTRGALWYDCTPDELREHIQFVLDNGGSFISVDQLHAHLMKGEPLPERSVCITFDDNYQGVYDHAVPVLREFGVPYAVFVHTAFVGGQTGRPKMSWETLQELVKDPLCTIGSHTVNHPADITQLLPSEQTKELQESKKALEERLGVPIRYIAYPDGKNDRITQELAKEAGYLLAFSTRSYVAEASPNILSVGRFEQSTLQRRWEERERELELAIKKAVVVDLKDDIVTVQQEKFGRVPLSLIRGGMPKSLLSAGRETVSEFIAKEEGAVAGINGSFFSMAAIASTDNRMVGPCLAENMGGLVPDPDEARLLRLRNRPLVAWDGKRIAFIPFKPNSMNSGESIFQFMPELKSLFVAGAWLVHDGVALTREQMSEYGAQDIQDYRRRAFIGVDLEGRFVAGAAMGSYRSDQVAAAIAEAGLREAVLLDSGFSTSLVFGEDVIASGHSTPDRPSRPVPHAIVMIGEKDPEAEYEKLPAPNARQPRQSARRRSQ